MKQTTLTLKKECGLIKMYLEKHGKIKKISEFHPHVFDATDYIKVKFEDIQAVRR